MFHRLVNHYIGSPQCLPLEEDAAQVQDHGGVQPNPVGRMQVEGGGAGDLLFQLPDQDESSSSSREEVVVQPADHPRPVVPFIPDARAVQAAQLRRQQREARSRSAAGAGGGDLRVQLQQLFDQAIIDGEGNSDEEDASDLSSDGPIVLPEADLLVINGRVVDEEDGVESSTELQQNLGHAAGYDITNPMASVFNPHPENIDVSLYDALAFPDDPMFLFQLDLAKLVDSIKPRPPNNFIDKLLKLIRRHVMEADGLDLGQKHDLNETFLKQLRTVMGRAEKPVVHKVAIESSTYQTLDQYDHRNEYRDTASVVVFNAYTAVKSILGTTAIFDDLQNLVVNQTGDNCDPFAVR